MASNKVKIGLMGLGNIGLGTYKTLEMNREAILAATGVDFEITKILERDVDRERDIVVPREKFTQDADDLFKDPEIQIVIGLLGIKNEGDFMLRAMENGKHVVTANKAAIAAQYDELREAAIRNNVMLRYEASVGGGIPILTCLTGALQANQYQEVLGILNGTTNYILTQMTDYDLNYEDVLKDAQAKGFAEPDPTADVEGIDVANKLSILISLVFGERVRPDEIPTTGITGVTKEDIVAAAERGCKIKLIASARKNGDKLEYSVKPTEIPFTHPLAGVSNEFNAVYVTGNAVDELMFYGRGAGPLPTGSAVMGDVIEIGKAIVKNAAYDLVVAGGK
ncbi:MAG: homoserine dehydrogenase [Firmicutes bacterium]|nr:homoserine dehydrogenase [Clostridiales bacterium]MBQ9932184.1 homoserine dehydrogenase [Bacillota bacterium]